MANRYWVGGTAIWDSTAGTKWSTTSGGTGGASVPTSADDVFFDDNSSGTVDIGYGAICKNITTTLFFNGRISWDRGYAITVYGNLTFAKSDHTVVLASNTNTGIIFNGISAATITTHGSTQPTWSFESANTWTVIGDVYFASGCSMSVRGGTSLNCKVIGDGSRMLYFSGNYNGINCVNLGYGGGGTSSGYIESFSIIASNVSLLNAACFISSLDTVNQQIKNCSVTIQGSSLGSRWISCTSTSTFTAITYTANSSLMNRCYLVQSYGGNVSVGTFRVQPTSGDFSFAADVSCSTGIYIIGSNRSTGRVLWVESYAQNPVSGTPTISLTNASFMNINPTGTTWSGTSLEDLGLNSNITFTAATTRTASVSGKWNVEATWGNNPMPLAQDTVVVNANVSVTGNRNFDSVGGAACSAFSMGTGSTFTGGLLWYGRSTKTIPSNVTVSNADFCFPDTLSNTNGGYTLYVGSDVKSLNFGLFPVSLGTTSINEKVLGVTVIPDTGTRNLGMVGVYKSPTRVIVSLPASSCTVGSLSCSVWDGQTYASGISCSGTVTINGTDTTYGQIIYSANSQSSVWLGSVVLSGNGTKTLRNDSGLFWNDSGLSMSSLSVTGTGDVNFTGTTGFSLGNVSRSSTSADIWKFSAGNTYYVNSWTAKGQSGAPLTLQSSSSSPFTLAYQGTSYVDIDYMSISNSTAIPANTWFAGKNSTDNGGNTGWVFTDSISTKNKSLFFGSNF